MFDLGFDGVMAESELAKVSTPMQNVDDSGLPLHETAQQVGAKDLDLQVLLNRRACMSQNKIGQECLAVSSLVS